MEEVIFYLTDEDECHNTICLIRMITHIEDAKNAFFQPKK